MAAGAASGDTGRITHLPSASRHDMSHQPSPPRRRGPIARVLVGAWHALDFSRRLVFNLLFLLIVVLLLVALATAERAKPVLDRTTLVIAPEGALVEQFSVDPVSRAFAKMSGQDTPEVRLRDLLRVIEKAAEDE